MNYLFRLTSKDLSAFDKNRKWFLIWGILLVVLGALAISAATFTTFASVVLLGILVFLSSAVIFFDTFTFWWGRWGGFALHFLVGALYFIVGGMFMMNPMEGSMSLTLLLGIFYVLLGVFRLAYSLSFKTPQWGWGLFNGIISLLLGILIMASWPASSFYIIGLFVGIDLLFCGWAYVMVYFATR